MILLHVFLIKFYGYLIIINGIVVISDRDKYGINNLYRRDLKTKYSKFTINVM